MYQKKSYLYILFILIFALVLRLPALLNRGGFWLDEIFSSLVAQLSLADSFKYLIWENNPPLHFWFLHFWGAVFGFSEFALRFSSIIVNLLATIVSYLFAKKLFQSRRIGYLTALINASAYFQVFISTEARMYSLLYLLSLLALYFFYLYLNSVRNKFLILNLFFTVLALYTHLTGFYILLIENLIFIYYVYKGKKPLIKQWIINQCAVFLLYLPWLIVFFQTKLATFNRQAWYFYNNDTDFYPWFLLKQFLFFTGTENIFELIFFLFFIVAFLFFICKISFREKILTVVGNFSLNKLLIILIILVPLMVGFILNISIAKYFILSAFGVYVVAAVFLDQLLAVSKKSFNIFIITLLIILFIIPGINNFNISLYNWPEVFSFIEQKERTGDVIVLAPNVLWVPYKYYYQGRLTAEVVPKFSDNDFLRESFKTNWNVSISDSDLKTLDLSMVDKKRIFLISGRNDTIIKDDLVFMWFLKKGWLVEEITFFKGIYDYKVVTLFKL